RGSGEGGRGQVEWVRLGSVKRCPRHLADRYRLPLGTLLREASQGSDEWQLENRQLLRKYRRRHDRHRPLRAVGPAIGPGPDQCEEGGSQKWELLRVHRATKGPVGRGQ